MRLSRFDADAYTSVNVLRQKARKVSAILTSHATHFLYRNLHRIHFGRGGRRILCRNTLVFGSRSSVLSRRNVHWVRALVACYGCVLQFHVSAISIPCFVE